MRNIDHFLTAGGDSNLTAIHNTRDLLLPTSYRLRVILDTLTKLGHLSSVLSSQHNGADNGFQKLVTCVAYHKYRLEGCVFGVEVLKEKVKDILNMVSSNSHKITTTPLADRHEDYIRVRFQDDPPNARPQQPNG